MFEISQQADEIFLQSSFFQATEFLKSRAGYTWEKRDDRVLSTWTIGTWSRNIQRSMIEKYGTEADKAVLPVATARNQPDKEKRTFVLCGDARAGGRVRRPNKTPRRQAIEERRETGDLIRNKKCLDGYRACGS